MREWVAKPVNFKRSDPEEKALYEFAGTLPNFTAMVKDWLRGLRDGVTQPNWQIAASSYQLISREEPEWIGEVDEGQFL